MAVAAARPETMTELRWDKNNVVIYVKAIISISQWMDERVGKCVEWTTQVVR